MRPAASPRSGAGRALVLGIAIAAIVAGCSTAAQSTPAPADVPTSSPGGATESTAVASEPSGTETNATPGVPAAAAPACSPDGSSDPQVLASWTGPVGGAAPIVPIIVSTQSVVGPNRFLYSIADTTNRPIAAPDLATRVHFYALERDPESVHATGEGTFLDTGTGLGLYRTSVDFDCAGQWGAEIEAALPDGSTATQRTTFTVRAEGTTPGIGEPAPRSDSLTASTPEEVGEVSTDPEPYAPAYERTIEEVVTAGVPSMVFFATPAFCTTGTCGPTMEVVKSVAADYEGDVGFVNVEPYELHMTANGLQPELSAEGQLQPVQAVLDYGIPTEPYLFVVDARGDVFATFEGVVGEDELRATLDQVLAAAT